MAALQVIEALAILLLGVLVVGLLRSHADIVRSLHDLGVAEPGSSNSTSGVSLRPRLNENPPADLAGQSLSGSALQIGVGGNSGKTLLAFLSSGCSACMGLWEEFRQADPLHGTADMRLVVVTKSREAESQSRLMELAPPKLTLIQSTQAWEDYGVPVSPYFVLVDGKRGEIVGEGSATSWTQVRSLLGQALSDAELRSRTDRLEGELAADAELRKAGIGKGHPSLYPTTPPGGD